MLILAGAALRGAVDRARPARARAEHAGQDGRGAGAGRRSASCSWCAGARRGDGGALVSPWWLVAAYTFHTFGELCLSPIGLSFVTKLAPAKFAALLMGLWFLSTAIAEFLAGQLAALTDKIARGELFHLFGGQADFFLVFVRALGGRGAGRSPPLDALAAPTDARTRRRESRRWLPRLPATVFGRCTASPARSLPLAGGRRRRPR